MAGTRLGSSGKLRQARAASKGKASLRNTKQVGGKTRNTLQYRGTVVKASRSNVTKAINKGIFLQQRFGGQPSAKAEALAEGVRNMTNTRLAEVLTDEEIEKVNNMDADKLEALYNADKFVFDTYFSYGGVNETAGAYEAAEGKADDVRFLIEQYERAFGEIRV